MFSCIVLYDLHLECTHHTNFQNHQVVPRATYIYTKTFTHIVAAAHRLMHQKTEGTSYQSTYYTHNPPAVGIQDYAGVIRLESSMVSRNAFTGPDRMWRYVCFIISILNSSQHAYFGLSTDLVPAVHDGKGLTNSMDIQRHANPRIDEN